VIVFTRVLRPLSNNFALCVLAVLGIGSAFTSSCVFELGDVVPGAGGSGGSGGSGGTNAAGGSIPGAQRTRIELDTSALVGQLNEFPLLLELTPDRVNYQAAGTEGADVRFYAEDGSTLLAHQVERWVVDGSSHVWVKLPVVEAGATLVLWMHVAEPAAPPAPDPTSVWMAYTAVYHFAESLSANSQVSDATDNARHGTAVMMDESNDADAMFGGGYRFDGVAGPSTHVDLGGDDVFRVPPSGVLTAEVWFQRSGSSSGGRLMNMEGCCLGWGMQFFGSPLQLRSQVGVGNCCSGSPTYIDAQFPIPTGSEVEWHQIVSVMDRLGGVLTSYFDGEEIVALPIVTTTTVGQEDLQLGSTWDGVDGFNGLMDEVRFSRRVLSAQWVDLQYATMTGQRISFGAPEALP
jgi:hypothetical protein